MSVWAFANRDYRSWWIFRLLATHNKQQHSYKTDTKIIEIQWMQLLSFRCCCCWCCSIFRRRVQFIMKELKNFREHSVMSNVFVCGSFECRCQWLEMDITICVHFRLHGQPIDGTFENHVKLAIDLLIYIFANNFPCMLILH